MPKIKDIQEATEEEKKVILEKTFLKREDFYKLLGLSKVQSNKMFVKIWWMVDDDLKKEDNPMRAPDSYHIPTVCALKYLKAYGIKK